jgi:hypothetical protein
MSRAWRWALLFALVLSCWPPAAQGQSSTPSSQVSEPLWQALLPIAQSLPSSYDLFMSSLTTQIDEQIANNALLRDSNNSLTLENAGLRESLRKSQEAEATSENKSTLLAKDLSDSTASTIRAQNDARALELQLGIWKGVGITFGVGLLAVAVYEGGHALKVW